ncbi:MAG: 30S ribosome-binding factor RbfA [bacterium]|nr:30S ribosome-binding factor RbfA [bacterium]
MAKISKDRKRELIREKLALILAKESQDPRFEGVTLADLKLSPDGSQATVFFSAFFAKGSPEEIERALNKSAGFFQSKLGQTIKTRNTPRLHFVYHRGFDHEDRIEEMLKAAQGPKPDVATDPEEPAE